LTSNNNEYADVNRLDSLFDKALVLLGILAAAELAYAPSLQMLMTDQSNIQLLHKLVEFTFRFTTVPFIILILFWMIKELFFKQKANKKGELFVTLFCWDFWSYSLYGFLLILLRLNTGVIRENLYAHGVAFTFAIILIALVGWAYGKTGPNPQSPIYSKAKWYKYHVLYAAFAAAIPFFIVFAWSFSVYG
jgi:hypothetical protein